MRYLFQITFLLVLLNPVFAQNKQAPSGKTNQPIKQAGPLPVKADCKEAILIHGTKYGPTVAPDGGGSIDEFGKHVAGPFYFEQEHNSAWYVFKASFTGELTFEIVPEKKEDDYDFLLYRYDSVTFCNAVLTQMLKPIRSNLVHNDGKGDGRTGLSADAKKECIGPGPGDPFSKSLHVKKGELYCLVLDNVHENGGGHTVLIKYVKESSESVKHEKVETAEKKGGPAKTGTTKPFAVRMIEMAIYGTICTEQKKGIKGELVIYDDNGKEYMQVTTGADGGYVIKGKFVRGNHYPILYYSDSLMIDRSEVGPDAGDGNPEKIYTTHIAEHYMKKLEAGRKYPMTEMRFFKNGTAMSNDSLVFIQGICKLMLHHPNMVIVLEGHVEAGKKGAENDQQVSLNMAKTFYDRLLGAGVDKKRMSYKGYGSGTPSKTGPLNTVEVDIISLN
jgi:hypothetical protein